MRATRSALCVGALVHALLILHPVALVHGQVALDRPFIAGPAFSADGLTGPGTPVAHGVAPLRDQPPPVAESPDAVAVPDPSPLERLYSDRAGEPLRLYGYDLLGGGSVTGMPDLGAVHDDYILGVGDVVSIAVRGSANLDGQLVVGSDGRLLLPQMRPVLVAGRSLADVRAELTAEVRATLGATELFLSLVELRRIVVQVLGEVGDPGRHRVASFATALDALSAAGGVNLIGSLRSGALIRHDLRSPIDLYDLLQENDSLANRPLRHGDRLFIPPLGATIAVAGAVLRPAIYELPPRGENLSAEEALALAGGALIPGPATHYVLRLGDDGLEHALPVVHSSATEFQLQDGDILRIQPQTPRQLGLVNLTGHVVASGPRPLRPGMTLADVIDSPTRLRPAPYLPFAIIASDDPSTGARQLVPIDVAAVLAGRDRRPVQDGDTVFVLSVEDIRFLTSAAVLTVLRGGAPDPDDVATCRGLAALHQSLSGPGGNGLAGSALAASAVSLAPSGALCPAIFHAEPDLLPLALAHGALLWQGVTRPGVYPAAHPTAIESLFAIAGAQGDVPNGRAGPGAVIGRPAPTVHLAGPVFLPGGRPLAEAETLAALLDGGAVIDQHDLYPLFGVVERLDRDSRASRLLAFSPRAVLNRESDLRLRDGDHVHLFTATDIDAFLARSALAPTTPVTAGDTGAPPSLSEPGSTTQPRVLGRTPGIARRFIADHVVTVDGAVRAPGAYPVAGETALEHLFQTAGGTTRDAGLADVDVFATAIDVSHGVVDVAHSRIDLAALDPAGVFVRPGDRVHIRPLHDAMADSRVTVSGEVYRPGAYAIARGERLSDLVRRAGGLTAHAYPDAAIFTRVSARERQRADLRQQADALDRRIASALLQPDPPTEAELVTAVDLVTQLRAVEPVGRLVIEADPDRLTGDPSLDIVLEGGDRVHFPARSPIVTVTGEVQAPATLQFRSGKGPLDYVREAGGYTRYADRDRVFVLFPDGRAQPVDNSAWSHTPLFVPPGSVIVIPRDPEPFDFLALSESVAGVLGQIALTAASINAITD